MTSNSEYRRTVQFLRKRAGEMLVRLEWIYRQSTELLKETTGRSPDIGEVVALAETILTELFDDGVLIGDRLDDADNWGRFRARDGSPTVWLARAREWIDANGRLPNDAECAHLHDPSVLAAMDAADIDPSFVNLLTNMDAFLTSRITAGQFDDLFTSWNAATRTELKDGTSIGYDTYQEIFYAVKDYVDDPKLREEIRDENLAQGHAPPLGPDELREVVAAARAKFIEELAAHGYDAHGHKITE